MKGDYKMDQLFEFVDKNKFDEIFNGKKKDKGGFEPLPKKEICTSPEHQPPGLLFIPPDQQYRHVCPDCGNTRVIRGSGVTF